MTMSTFELPVIYLYLGIKNWNKSYDRIRTETLKLIHIGRTHEVFMTTSCLNMGCALIIIGDAFRKRVLTILMCLTLKCL